jgi:membrane protein
MALLHARKHARKLRHWLGWFWTLASETLDEFSKDRGDLVAAALAFFTMLSLAPLIIVAVAGAGIVLGQGAAHREALRVIEETMGPGAASAIDGWVLEASRAGGVASLVGAGLTLFAASRFTNQLRSALNQVWNVDVFVAEGFKSTIKDYVKRRAFAFALVLASGPVLLAVFLSRALLTGVGAAVFPEWALGGASVQILQLLFSFFLVAAATAVVFRFIPDTRVGWRAISRGALLTSLLFNVSNVLVGIYLGKASVGATYGAAGSLVVVLLWLYFSAEIFLYGAEFTQVYARHHGRGLNQKEEAEVQKAQQSGRRAADAASNLPGARPLA